MHDLHNIAPTGGFANSYLPKRVFCLEAMRHKWHLCPLASKQFLIYCTCAPGFQTMYLCIALVSLGFQTMFSCIQAKFCIIRFFTTKWNMYDQKIWKNSWSSVNFFRIFRANLRFLTLTTCFFDLFFFPIIHEL